ncbi:hypothetical protein JR316_0008225 [Psilocybe cubensis]|uniref:Uncharacterized protein n=2 Tax=Psilocybe cubensis TaxID=181762 RepID=A0ACB8GXE7_PSICU|nr:hypothetical protein JR316_0008225 [Psilocybe cubensis]KAH9479630.1 hypothetical protein JR316_0008225 [Psilocybe cubensis]
MPPVPIQIAAANGGSSPSSTTSTSTSTSTSSYTRSSSSIAAQPPALPVTTTTSSTSTTRRGSPTPTFSDDRENYHRVEFEAPLSAGVEGAGVQQQQQAQLAQGRFSIDLSLELERELENMESPPVTPVNHSARKGRAGSDASHVRREDSVKQEGHADDPAPDPEILAHIITQLRRSLAEMTKERDDLLKMMEDATRREAEAQDALQIMTEKATAAEEQMMEMRRKMKEDEDQISLLRTKVEESRRGLMRLQTEKRQSMTPIDIARASGALASFGNQPSSKRASFVPLTGSGRQNGHKRISSVNDSSFGAFPTPDMTPSPNAHAFNIAATEAILSGAPASSGSRRFFGRQSPDGDGLHSAASADSAAAATAAEMVAMRKELQAVKDELEMAKHDLIEAKEAKEASETCVTALREFIAENNVGAAVGGEGAPAHVKLPPPPTMATGEEEYSDSKKTGTGWGFKLWGSSSSNSSGSGSNGNDSSSGAGPYSASVTASPMLPSSSAALAHSPASATPIGTAAATAPLSRKLGGFFSSRVSTSSSDSREQSRTPLPPPLVLPQLQTNAAATRMPSQRDSMYSYSDASSVAEPVSPGSDINGLGTAGYVKTAAGFEKVGVVAEEEMQGGITPVHVSMSTMDLEGLR